jgi:hypothetical protein
MLRLLDNTAIALMSKYPRLAVVAWLLVCRSSLIWTYATSPTFRRYSLLVAKEAIAKSKSMTRAEMEADLARTKAAR